MVCRSFVKVTPGVVTTHRRPAQKISSVTGPGVMKCVVSRRFRYLVSPASAYRRRCLQAKREVRSGRPPRSARVRWRRSGHHGRERRQSPGLRHRPARAGMSLTGYTERMTTASPAALRSHASAGLVVTCASQFLIGVDGLAVAIALPALRDDLRLATIDAQWVLTAYALCFGGGLLLGGRLGDLYGRRRVLICGLALLPGGSLRAAVSPGPGVLIAGGAPQGAGAAAAIPATLALIGSL